MFKRQLPWPRSANLSKLVEGGIWNTDEITFLVCTLLFEGLAGWKRSTGVKDSWFSVTYLNRNCCGCSILSLKLEVSRTNGATSRDSRNSGSLGRDARDQGRERLRKMGESYLTTWCELSAYQLLLPLCRLPRGCHPSTHSALAPSGSPPTHPPLIMLLKNNGKYTKICMLF